MADRSAGLDAGSLRKGMAATFTGLIGQRASRKNALDGYRLWLRDTADIAPEPLPSASPGPSAGGPSAPLLPIAAAVSREGERVAVEGVLTIDVSLLDTSARRTIVEDATGAIEVYLASPDSRLRTGVRVRVTGTVGRAYGAPRLRAEEIAVVGATRPTPRSLLAAPAASDEWRLVRVSGTVVDLHRLGVRWRAELDMAGVRIPIVGLDGSGIASTALVEGRRATIVGVVRRAAPSAMDQRLAVVPRDRADVLLGPVEAAGSAGTRGSAPRTAGKPGLAGLPVAGHLAVQQGAVQDVDLARLADHIGQVVRVGGLVSGLGPDGIDLDDGTATVHVVLAGEAAALLDLLEPGDVLNATGTPERRGDVVLLVSDPAALVLVGDPSAVGDPQVGATAGPRASSVPVADGHAVVRASIERGMGLDPASAGIGTLVLLSAMSLVATVARRHRARRLLVARVVARIEAMRQAAPRAGRGRDE
jgi:hypothetical protein